MLILGIETSCDETAAAVVADGSEVRSNIIASQHAIHAAYGGVVPELACRSHIENLQPVIGHAWPRISRSAAGGGLSGESLSLQLGEAPRGRPSS